MNERITEKSPEIFAKSTNHHNRIKIFMEPLDEVTMKLIREGAVKCGQDVKDQAIFLSTKAGWNIREARRIWEIFNESVLINGAFGIQRLDRIKDHICKAFREWLKVGPLCKKPVIGIKVTLIDATVHLDPSHTGYNEIASMMNEGLTQCFQNTKPICD